MTTWKAHEQDGAVLVFDRRRGLNLLLDGGPAAAVTRAAPRTLLVSLLTECNLRCAFCYRDRRAPSLWTREDLVLLLTEAAAWGVVDVAFGGGEPLLFPSLGAMLRELYETTLLGLSLTTNGTRLDERFLAEAGDSLSEIRVSAYRDNGYRDTLARLRGRQVGVNWLVTPGDVGLVEPVVWDALSRGAKNVLLLGYKGQDARLRLSPAELATLAQAVRRLEGLPIRLDICWTPELDVPRLFTPGDCGAGDAFLMLTADKKAKPCSFHHESIPVETIDDLRAAWTSFRSNRQGAAIGGCTRERFTQARIEPPARAVVHAWTAWSSNHSSSYTMVGRFQTAALAADAARELRAVFAEHMQYLGSEEGKALDFDSLQMPTPPLLELGREHGFDWGDDDTNTFWWESMEPPDPGVPPTILAEGLELHLFHSYCFQFPGQGLRRYIEARGGTVSDFNDGLPKWTVVAWPVSAATAAKLQACLDAIRADSEWTGPPHESPYDTTPPWGETVEDPRFSADEDRNATLMPGPHGEHSLAFHDGRLEAALEFYHPFHGAVACERWLRAEGATEVQVRLA
jgi:hypothetical protein